MAERILEKKERAGLNGLKMLICGGRHFCDYTLLESVADKVVKDYDFSQIEIVSGHCIGADRLCEEYARRRNFAVKIFPAEWKNYGKRAGPIRNKQMIDYIAAFEDKVVIAFTSPNTKGTKNTIALAQKANIRVIETKYHVGG